MTIRELEPGGYRDRCGRCGGWISLGHAQGSDCRRDCDHIPKKAALDDEIGCIKCGEWLGKAN